MVDACSSLHLNIYLYSKSDKGQRLIYFYGCFDLKRILGHQNHSDICLEQVSQHPCYSSLMSLKNILHEKNVLQLFPSPPLNVSYVWTRRTWLKTKQAKAVIKVKAGDEPHACTFYRILMYVKWFWKGFSWTLLLASKFLNSKVGLYFLTQKYNNRTVMRRWSNIIQLKCEIHIVGTGGTYYTVMAMNVFLNWI